MEQLQQALSTPPPNWQPPPGAASNPIAILHASLEHLRNTGDEQYLFLRAILELLTKHGYLGAADSSSAIDNGKKCITTISGDEEQLLFHCVTGVRHVMLFRWEYFQPSFRSCVRDFLLAIGLGCFPNSGSHADNLGLPRTFTLACLSAAASFWKRAWTGSSSDDTTQQHVQQDNQQNYLESLISTNLMPTMQRFNGTNGQELFAYLNSLLAAPFEQSLNPVGILQHNGAMAASFLSLLVGEFTGGNSSARYNLPIEFHRLCHQVFENGNEEAVVSTNGNKSGLDTTLQASMSALSSYVGFILSKYEGHNEVVNDAALLDLGTNIVSLTYDVLSWEFGASSGKWDFSSGSTKKDGSSVLLRPPQRWREALINPEFLGAMFRVYSVVRVGGSGQSLTLFFDKRGKMAHQLRQLLLQLASIASGPIFADENERGAYAGFLLDGCLDALENILTENQQRSMVESDLMSAEVIDLVTMLSRLATNFRVKTLSNLSSFPRFLSAMAMVGKWLLEGSLAEVQRAEGDLEITSGLGWKYDAVSQILQCSEAMADDYWLVSGDAQTASDNLANILAPLYGHYVACRVRMSSLEEHYLTQEGEELDEVGEEIWAFGLGEEMESAASLGRLNISASLTTLSGMFQQCVPQLMTMFDAAGNGSQMTPVMAALLEEVRLLILCACHLLTDECEGETPSIPDAVIQACQGQGRISGNDSCLASIVSLIELLRSVAEAQAMKVSAHPTESSLSPLLAKTLIWFFRRWSAAYVLPVSDEYHKEGIFVKWSTPESAGPIISFCTTLSLIYFCHWPQEKEVQDESTGLLLILAKKGPFVRQLMVDSPSFEQIAALHSICSSLRHNATQAETAASMSSFGGNLSIDVVRGYQRLPYVDRARVLTCLVVGCSDMENEKSNAMLDGCLKAVANHFSALVEALSNKQANANDINVQESACLSILLYCGIVCGSEMSEPERVPHFITPYLPHLSGLMTYYAEDLTICEALLKLFRDYAERYLAMISRDQCISLFTSSASLLKLYSEYHCKNRVIHKRPDALEGDFEEEQSYQDILSAIQLLIHLGTKDFTDLCNSSKGIETGQITDVIFFGLQQILPLMTQGLLQYPTLCQMYFSLVGFMVETYPEKLCALPFELFNSLLDSLLFGMSHSDSLVSKSSLQGLASLAKEHLKTHALASHLATKGDIIENCSQRLIQEVIFQPIIWDRLEPSGMALLPLAAIDVQKFIVLVNAISQQLGSEDKQQRMHRAFEKLIKPQVLAKVAADGREGRMVRIQFKNNFDVFVRDVHSFLIMK